MKTASYLRGADPVVLGLLVAFTGCTSPVVRQATSEASLAPAFDATAQQDFHPPKPLHVVKPDYPFDLRRAGVSGVVMVNCLVDEKGRVQDPRVDDTLLSPAFSTSAIDAIRQWKFTPAMRDGKAVAVRVSLPVNFVFTDD